MVELITGCHLQYIDTLEQLNKNWCGLQKRTVNRRSWDVNKPDADSQHYVTFPFFLFTLSDVKRDVTDVVELQVYIHNQTFFLGAGGHLWRFIWIRLGLAILSSRITQIMLSVFGGVFPRCNLSLHNCLCFIILVVQCTVLSTYWKHISFWDVLWF